MSQGNKRYLGDTFIQQDNMERQRQFFKDIIKTYEGKYMGDFNALSLWDEDTKTEKFVRDFATAEQGQKAENAMQSPIYLGKQSIVNTEQQQRIYTDAILLDTDDSDLMDIPWFTNAITLDKALINIHGNVMDLSDVVDTKLDASIYNKFYNTEYKNLKDSFDDVFLKFTDANGEEVYALDSDLTNGIRFIVTTQEKYQNDYTEADKKYWRNFFIIKDASEIPPDYADPLKLQLTDGYEFRVADGYLQVSNRINDQWKNICSLTELLSGTSFSDNIYAYITNPDNVFRIGRDSVLESLSQLEADEIDDTEFLSTNFKDDFIHDIKINNSTDNITVTTTTNGFKDMNINMETVIDEQVSPSITSINTTLNSLTNTTDGKIPVIQGQISSISQDISSIKGVNNTQNTSISSLQTSLNNVLNSLEGISQSIEDLSNEINNWEIFYPQGLVYREKNDTSKPIKYRSYNKFNRKLGLAIMHVHFNHYHLSDNAGVWVSPQFNNKKAFFEKYPDCVPWADPINSTVSYISASCPDCKIRLGAGGDTGIFVYVPKGVSEGYKSIFGHFIYAFDPASLEAYDTMPDYSNYNR